MESSNGRKTFFNAPDPPTRGSYWADLPRGDQFTQMVATRTRELSPRYGSWPVQLGGPTEPDVVTRIKRRERERRYHRSAYAEAS